MHSLPDEPLSAKNKIIYIKSKSFLPCTEEAGKILKGELSLIKTANVAYQENVPERITENKMPVIQMYTNGQLVKERVILEGTAVLEKKPVYEKIKRFGDIFCSALALTVLSPLLLATAVLIMIDDFGSPFYVQTRIGKNGKEFKIYKFRTMYKDADARKAELMKKNEDNGANFKIKEDPRITRVGGILRKTSIDELPQLLNILKGDMSIIGPRPFIPAEQEKLPFDRLLVPPGLSCYWQIGGKNELSEAEQIALDRKYIKERSLGTDVKIVCKTIVHVLTGKNS